MRTCGIDEVGRGCWAGPLVAGAIILPESFQLDECPVVIRDSKRLTKKQRELSSEWILNNALSAGLGWVDSHEIDMLGITESVRLAMHRAFAALDGTFDEIIIDGNVNYFQENPKAKAIVKADGTIACVSAASIVAKVARDTYMSSLGQQYKDYGFEKHVGYGTAYHRAALQRLGICDLHRRSYKPIQALVA